MEMKCPYCDVVDNLMAIHRHLVEAHLDWVTTERDKATNKMQFSVACPLCDEQYQHRVKPRSRNPHFLKEFKAEIALVAFDQMLYHIIERHAEDVGVDVTGLDLNPDTET